MTPGIEKILQNSKRTQRWANIQLAALSIAVSIIVAAVVGI